MYRAVLTAAVMCLSLGAGTARGEVKGYKVVTDQSIDASSLETIVRQVIERSGARTNDEKAIALYEWLHQTIFHSNYPREPKPQTIGPLKIINVYGWGLCGSQHTVLKALYETAGWKCRYVGWSNPGHTTVEVFYDDRWHYFDVFLKCYFWSKDRTHVVSQEEIAADPSIVFDAVKDGRAARQHLCCGDAEKGVVSGCKSRKVIGDSKGWASCTWRDQNYSPLVTLPVGASLRLDWKGEANGFAIAGKPPVHKCGMKDFRNDPVLGPIVEHYGPRGYSSGLLVYAPDFSKSACLKDVGLANVHVRDGALVADGKGTATFKLNIPYAFVNAKVDVGYNEGEGKLFLSTDGGLTWTPVKNNELAADVKQRYEVWLRTEFTGTLSKFRVEAVVEHNRGALPYLVTGKNKVVVSLAQKEIPEDYVLVVTLIYEEATAPLPRMRFDGQGLKYGKPVTVTKEITSVPFTLDIDVGGNTLPRMVSLERAVRAR